MNTKNIVQQILLFLLLIAIIVTLVIGLWPAEEVHQKPGILAKGAPKITRIHRDPIRKNGYEFLPVGMFSFKGRVLQRQRYYYALGIDMFAFDKPAAVSPVDLLIGWNEMSDETTLEIFRFYLDGRKSAWKPDDINDRPKLEDLVELNTALVHVIPGSASIKAKLRNVYVGHIIECKGEIVKVQSTETAFSWGTAKLDESISKREYIVHMTELVIVK
jgi:hypothetical protein